MSAIPAAAFEAGAVAIARLYDDLPCASARREARAAIEAAADIMRDEERRRAGPDEDAMFAMACWAASAVALVVIALAISAAPVWLRGAVCLLALVAAFCAGLVAIPTDDKEKP